MLDLLTDLFKFMAYMAVGVCLLLSLPFVVAHVAENWDAAEYPHSGYTPDWPTWEAAEEPENSLPPCHE